MPSGWKTKNRGKLRSWLAVDYAYRSPITLHLVHPLLWVVAAAAVLMLQVD